MYYQSFTAFQCRLSAISIDILEVVKILAFNRVQTFPSQSLTHVKLIHVFRALQSCMDSNFNVLLWNKFT